MIIWEAIGWVRLCCWHCLTGSLHTNQINIYIWNNQQEKRKDN